MEKIKEEIKSLKRKILIEELTQSEIRLISRRIKILESKLEEPTVI